MAAVPDGLTADVRNGLTAAAQTMLFGWQRSKKAQKHRPSSAVNSP